MARYYGSAQGERGEAHRLGHHEMKTVAASYKGGVQVKLYAYGDKEMVEISTVPWLGRGARTLLYDGPLADLQDASPENPAWKARAHAPAA